MNDERSDHMECEPQDSVENGTADASRQAHAKDSRRQFLGNVGKAAMAGGLAHFLLLGRKAKKALAAGDICPAPYTNPPDVCDPSDSNQDNCSPEGAPSTVDECSAAGDYDRCDISGPTEAGDLCNVSGDRCTYAPYTAAAGDVCSPAYTVNDVCDYGDGIKTADRPQ